MVTLRQINESNYSELCALQPTEQQRQFVASATGILARAYALREQRAQAWAIYAGETAVGVLLVHDMDDEPACYHLMELLVDAKHQRRGYARAALRILLAELQAERKYPTVELCVKREDRAAIALYQSLGFTDTGYTDPDAPDSLCMAKCLCEQPQNEAEPNPDLALSRTALGAQNA